ncbi:DUF3347 domain-containing protein [Leptospira semungkisensis]|uniref:DUF3347 domain-containing protein n=1 Tax=Leptospira semungkisensis TaxID=2484985 RepID=A0A4V3JAU7_9LEPT|nr:DUF3347 domain-containing protein [Leptospira semungkisensis]TGJ99138.1 DUF3347 domain-containing protein [Leptospira semungkisensis]
MKSFALTSIFFSVLISSSVFAHEGKESFVLKEVARIHTEIFEERSGTIDTKKLEQLLQENADSKKAQEHFKKAFAFVIELGKAKDLSQKRDLFYKISTELETILGHHDKSGVSSFYCPMLRKKWLASGKTIRNPYDSGMKNCGEISHAAD